MKFDPNDPKWTAYVLNELNDRECAEVEREIARNPEAQQLVGEIQLMTGRLQQTFADEPTIALNDTQKRVVLDKSSRRPAGRVFAFPTWSYVTISAAAALLIAVIGFRMQHGAKIQTEREVAAVAKDDADVVILSESASDIVGFENVDEGLTVMVDLPAEATPDQSRLDGAVSGEKMPADVSAPLVVRGLYQGRSEPGRRSDQFDQMAKRESLDMRDESFAERRRQRVVESPLPASPSSQPAPKVLSRNTVGYVRMNDADGFYMREEFERQAPIISPSLDDFPEIRPNTFQRVTDHPLSTFSIDVDTASYSVVRKFLSEGRLPPRDAVRIEEMINYFPYDYLPPRDGKPFASHMEIAPNPWRPEHHLVRIAIKGREIPAAERPALNLTYLIDVSGSMNSPNRLPLVKRSLQALVQQLDGHDRVAIVVYAGAAGLVLPSTRGDHAQTILDAIERLQAGGSTAGGAGIQLAYATAREHFQSNAVNRVILCTDGDFNVGLTQRGDLERLIEHEAKSGVFLTALGFGMGNYKDSTLEILSNKGNGNYAYIDDFSEARKVLVDQMLGTLVTIAKDVKIQVEFNPAHVAGYRLIGYENRMLKKEDFNNDKVDAGEIGAGHTVTAFYELVPAGQPLPGEAPGVDELKYQPTTPAGGTRPRASMDAESEHTADEILTLKLRYKEPDSDVSSKLEFALHAEKLATMDPSRDFRFASAVAGFGMVLRESEHRGNLTHDQVLKLAENSLGSDELGYRAEFIKLVRNAKSLSGAGDKP